MLTNDTVISMNRAWSTAEIAPFNEIMTYDSLRFFYALRQQSDIQRIAFKDGDQNISTDRIKYNFCYPILKPDSLPQDGLVFFKEFQGGAAVKATYNGNYISSDRAWYALLEYAEKKGLKVKETPVEIFFNNPNMGGDALKWRADIYLPLESSEIEEWFRSRWV